MSFTLEMILIGGLTGILSGLLGVGGGFIMIPLLNAAGLLMREAVGLSLLYVAFTATSATLRHLKIGTVDPVLALILLGGATPMAVVGSHYATTLPNYVLEIAFALLAIGATAAYLGRGRGKVGAPAKTFSRPDAIPRYRHILLRRRRVENEELFFTVNIFSGLLLGGCLGIVAGLLGIGGGFLLVPLLVLVMRIPIQIAVGTSLLAILGPAVAGAATHWKFGNFDLKVSIPLILAGIIGAQIGAILVVRIPSIWLERLLVFLLIVAAIYMLGQGLGLL